MLIHEVFYTYDDIHKGAKILAYKIIESGFNPDLIIGVARGGLMPAAIIAQSFKVPVIAVNYSSKEGQANDKHHIDDTEQVNQYIDWLYERYPERSTLNILICDDIADTSKTIAEITNSLESNGEIIQDNLRTAVLFYRNLPNATQFKPDYYWIELTDTKWIHFPWES